MIEGPEWIILAFFFAGVLVCAYWVISVQGDLIIDDAPKVVKSNDDAIQMFLDLINQTDKRIVIHDDGENSPESIFNDDQVLEAVRSRIAKHDISVQCLFNDNDQNLKFLDLVREYPKNVHVSYIRGGRPNPDTHYKIVDSGKLVHLSSHDHDDNERTFVLRKPPTWALGTRRRISQAYMEHYTHGLENATHLRV